MLGLKNIFVRIKLRYQMNDTIIRVNRLQLVKTLYHLMLQVSKMWTIEYETVC